MSQPERAQWASHFGFIMAAAGSAIGLGNLWRFPYLTGRYGGGIFVVVYLIIILLVGFTIVLGEMAIGRATQLNSYGAYQKIKPRWGIVGGLGLLAGFLILSFYSVIGGWVIHYMVQYLLGGISGDSAQYFNSFIKNPYLPISWHLIFMVITAYIVIGGVAGGIEKYSKIILPALFLFLIIIVIRSVTLPGSWAGILFYMKPDFSKLNAEGVVAALGQVFFSLSLGMGCMITYGSYLSRSENLEKNAIIIPFLDTLAALLAGFAILPAVFAFNYEPGSGPGLMFVTLPQVFQHMPLGRFFGLLFFILTFFAAITSSISLLEVEVAYLVDQFHFMRNRAVILLSSMMFLLGIPCSLSVGPWSNYLLGGKSIFDWFDYISSNVLLPFGGFLMCIFIGYVWKVELAVVEITDHGRLPFRLRRLWIFCIRYVAPLALLVIFFNMLGIIHF